MLKFPSRRINPRSVGQIRCAVSNASTYDWPSSGSSQASSNPLANVVEMSRSTSQVTAVYGTKRETLVSFTPDSFYNPQDFLRSRRIASDQHGRTPPSVGPDSKTSLANDAFRYLQIEPLREANNNVLLRNFMTGMAKILPRSKTNLSWRSQRMMAQAIKRAKQKGILAVTSNPDWHKRM